MVVKKQTKKQKKKEEHRRKKIRKQKTLLNTTKKQKTKNTAGWLVNDQPSRRPGAWLPVALGLWGSVLFVAWRGPGVGCVRPDVFLGWVPCAPTPAVCG